MPPVQIQKLMWGMTLFHKLNNLSSHEVNIEFSISKYVVM